MDLQGLHRMLFQIALFRRSDHPYSREVFVVSIDGDTNQHHVEGDRYDRHDLIDGSSLCFNNRHRNRDYHVHHNIVSVVREEETD
jgi:hypothetical protein